MCWLKEFVSLKNQNIHSVLKKKKVIRKRISFQHKPAGFSPKDGAVIAGNLMLVPLPCWLLSSLNGPCAKPPPPAPITKGKNPSSRDSFNLKILLDLLYAFKIPSYFPMSYSNMDEKKK